jgi:hypothetical protein
VLTLLATLFLGSPVRGLRQHRRVEAIKALGAEAGAGYDVAIDPATGSFETPDDDAVAGPKWLRRLVGDDLCDDMFANVVGVWIGVPGSVSLGERTPDKDELTTLGDGEVAQLAQLLQGFPRLQRVSLNVDSKTTDAGVAHLAGIRQLISLDLSETAVTDFEMRQ